MKFVVELEHSGETVNLAHVASLEKPYEVTEGEAIIGRLFFASGRYIFISVADYERLQRAIAAGNELQNIRNDIAMAIHELTHFFSEDKQQEVIGVLQKALERVEALR